MRATDRPASRSDLDREEFARLFSRNARRIYGFIMTLVFNHHDAEEVFQNTNVVLWNDSSSSGIEHNIEVSGKSSVRGMK